LKVLPNDETCRELKGKEAGVGWVRWENLPRLLPPEEK